MSEAEMPSAPTKERMEEHQTRTLLKGGAMPEGNRTVSWIWRGSLKDDSRDHAVQREYGEGLLFNFSNHTLFLIPNRVST